MARVTAQVTAAISQDRSTECCWYVSADLPRSSCRSLTQALTIVIQAALDAGAAYGAFSLAGFLGAAENIPLHNIWGFGATFLGSYFGEATCC